MSFQGKYLKYKNKYLKLKKQRGGQHLNIRLIYLDHTYNKEPIIKEPINIDVNISLKSLAQKYLKELADDYDLYDEKIVHIVVDGEIVDENLTLAGNDGKMLTLNASVTLQTVSNIAITLNLGSRSTGTIGWSDVPQIIKPGSYSDFTVDDVGKHFYHSNATAGDTYTIPAGVFAIGATLMFVNRGANLTIRCDPVPTGSPAPATESLLQAITGSSGARTLAGFGVATMLKITATEWIISGTGLS